MAWISPPSIAAVIVWHAAPHSWRPCQWASAYPSDRNGPNDLLLHFSFLLASARFLNTNVRCFPSRFLKVVVLSVEGDGTERIVARTVAVDVAQETRSETLTQKKMDLPERVVNPLATTHEIG
jgi:hypothetical protein